MIKSVNFRFFLIMIGFILTWVLLHELWCEVRNVQEQLYELRNHKNEAHVPRV